MPNTAPSQTLNPAAENGASRKETSSESEGSYKAKRYAVKFQPPCIFLEYEDTTRRRRVRAVKLNGIQANVDVDRLTKKVIRSFPRRLDPTSVKYDQVRRLVVSLVDFLSAGTHSANGAAAGADTAANGCATVRNGTFSHVPSRLGPGSGSATGGSKGPGRLTDFNDLTNSVNGGASVASPLPSLSPRGIDPRIGPAARMAMSGLNANYRGSVESTMSRFSTSTASPSDSGGSTSGEEMDGASRRDGGGLASALDDLDKEMACLGGSTSDLSTMATAGGSGGVSSELGGEFCTSPLSTRDRPLPPLASSVSPAPSRMGSMDAQAGAAAASGGAKTRFAAEAEKLVIGLEVTDDLDLNKVTEVELKLAKQVMEADFQKNQLRPGDPGYVYDKQEEFGPPTEVNDWDDSDDDDAEPSEEPEVDWADIHASVSKPKGTFTSVQVNAGLSSEEESAGRNGQSPYNSNDWP
ncbi:hypothetical protein Vretimale_3467 [Volvox reticuliferus]|uniref:Centrosomal protein of 19 kDa n=1 Tax=Volvox reticuliferus TaxID=1737510 RepID=A0A8J4BW47_9CHLO|nr:hypothetical protein Vretifemale_971 [Volvox reticuliferus]GIL98069.1 hypothetical protein Vretimale_3467 [Volvox reticuliferus]